MTEPLRSRLRSASRLWMVCFAVAALCAGAACASGATGKSARPRQRADLITAEEMQHRQSANAYDLIQAMRGTWLHIRGRDTILGQQGEIVVMLDGVRLGGIEALRQVPVMGLASIQYYNPIDASARWGMGHGHGVIALTSRAR